MVVRIYIFLFLIIFLVGFFEDLTSLINYNYLKLNNTTNEILLNSYDLYNLNGNYINVAPQDLIGKFRSKEDL